jgi:hypothetical protein
LEIAKAYLKDKYDWKDYGLKHEESIFTGWFQNKYLPEKFGIDKRKAHLSSLINARQLTKGEAKAILDSPKQGFEFPVVELDEKEIMTYPKLPHTEYLMETWYEDIAKIIKEK